MVTGRPLTGRRVRPPRSPSERRDHRRVPHIDGGLVLLQQHPRTCLAIFTDLALLADQTGIDTGASLSGARSLDITRAYVRAFFDQHLRGRPQALLDQPSSPYPEVMFCTP